MQIMSQRLTTLFQIMLKSKTPVTVSELAKNVSVSTRTVFRELENIDVVLKKYNLVLDTSVKEGLYLKGSQEDLDVFAQVIQNSSQGAMVNKNERRITLAFALLNSTQWQKLYYYSSLLNVSEATISLDFDIIQRDIEQFNLKLLRKKGVGVLIEGDEEDIRAAMVFYMSKDNDNVESFAVKYDFPPNNIESETKEIISYLSMQLEWITADTIQLLLYALCIQVTRVSKNCFVTHSKNTTKSGILWQLAQRIADEINLRFALNLPDAEIELIEDVLNSSRAKQKKPVSLQEETQAFSKARSLAFLLIERFDDRIAPTLKTNEEFVRGLSVHLYSAIGRIKSGYIITDHLSEQIISAYPDIYERTKTACLLLEKEFNRKIPKGEIANIATHFGAAVMQIGQDKLKRKLKVGIVCLGGIGISYMLNSQVKKHFSNEVITEISEYNAKEQWRNNDFIISTIPLKISGIPVVIVSPVLTSQNYETIRNTIDSLKVTGFKHSTENNKSLLNNIEKTCIYLKEIDFMLKNFAVIDVADATTVEDFAKFSGYRFGNNSYNGELIYNALMHRENVSSQIIESLNLLLLHCVSENVFNPHLAVLSNNKTGIANTTGQKAQTCLLIMLPKSSTEQLKQTIGAISVAIIENDDFLNTILNENENDIYFKLQEILQTKLAEYFNETFKI